MPEETSVVNEVSLYQLIVAPIAVNVGLATPKQITALPDVTGADGIGLITSIAVFAEPSHPFTVCVTVYK